MQLGGSNLWSSITFEEDPSGAMDTCEHLRGDGGGSEGPGPRRSPHLTACLEEESGRKITSSLASPTNYPPPLAARPASHL